MRRAFGKAIVELAEFDPGVVLITGDVEQEMTEFKARFPDRFFNLGLCEQAITSMAAGLAIEGLRPVVYSITPFVIERPFEQVKLDIDEQNLPIMLIGYSDYPTHGPTHKALGPEVMALGWKNLRTYFPCDGAEVGKVMVSAFISRTPSMIHLKKAP